MTHSSHNTIGMSNEKSTASNCRNTKYKWENMDTCNACLNGISFFCGCCLFYLHCMTCICEIVQPRNILYKILCRLKGVTFNLNPWNEVCLIYFPVSNETRIFSMANEVHTHHSNLYGKCNVNAIPLLTTRIDSNSIIGKWNLFIITINWQQKGYSLKEHHSQMQQINHCFLFEWILSKQTIDAVANWCNQIKIKPNSAHKFLVDRIWHCCLELWWFRDCVNKPIHTFTGNTFNFTCSAIGIDRSCNDLFLLGSCIYFFFFFSLTLRVLITLFLRSYIFV